jgi:hypothetical protein
MTLRDAAELVIRQRPEIAPTWSFVLNILMPYEKYKLGEYSIDEDAFFNLINTNRSVSFDRNNVIINSQVLPRLRILLAGSTVAPSGGAGEGAVSGVVDSISRVDVFDLDYVKNQILVEVEKRIKERPFEMSQLSKVKKYFQEPIDKTWFKQICDWYADADESQNIAEMYNLCFDRDVTEASVPAGPLIEIVGRSISQEFSHLCYDQIEDQIWLGSFEGLSFGGAEKITYSLGGSGAHIVHINAKDFPKKECSSSTYFYIYSFDAASIEHCNQYIRNVSLARTDDAKTLNRSTDPLPEPKDWFKAAFESIEIAISQGKVIFVSCSEGISRSCTFMIAWLIKKGMTLQEAFDLVVSKRPQVAPSCDFVINILMPYEFALRRSCSIADENAFCRLFNRNRSEGPISKTTTIIQNIDRFLSKKAELFASAPREETLASAMAP